LLVHIGGPSSNQATTLESQMIHMIQELFGQTLSERIGSTDHCLNNGKQTRKIGRDTRSRRFTEESTTSVHGERGNRERPFPPDRAAHVGGRQHHWKDHFSRECKDTRAHPSPFAAEAYGVNGWGQQQIPISSD
jgi:hypothetical protein